jgi:hypothetical protein
VKVPLKKIKIQCYTVHYIIHIPEKDISSSHKSYSWLINCKLKYSSRSHTTWEVNRWKTRFCKKYKMSADVQPREKTGTYLTIHYIFYYEWTGLIKCSQKLITPIRQTLIAITWLLCICSTYIFHPVLKQFFVLLQYQKLSQHNRCLQKKKKNLTKYFIT